MTARRIAVAALLSVGLIVPLSAHVRAARNVGSKGDNPMDKIDKLSMLEGSPEGWSVSRTNAGCYLLSPYRRHGGRTAIGRHPELGLGLFAINFALAMPGVHAAEPMVINIGDEQLEKAGSMTANNLLFAPLNDAEVQQSLQGLRETSTLWLKLRGTWIAHGGLGAAEAVARYGQTCATNNDTAKQGNVK